MTSDDFTSMKKRVKGMVKSSSKPSSIFTTVNGHRVEARAQWVRQIKSHWRVDGVRVSEKELKEIVK